MQQISASALIREASVGDYVALRSLVNSVEKPCQKAKDITKQDVKLVSFLKELLERTWSSMKDALSQYVRALLFGYLLTVTLENCCRRQKI